MKKILSFIFVVVLLLSSVIPAFAAETVVDYDKTNVVTDLKSVYGDKVTSMFPKVPSKTKMSLITVFEHGYTKATGFSSSDYGLYIYMYNPSGIKVSGSILDVINMANGWDSKGAPSSYTNNYIKLVSYSNDYTLLKYKVVNKGKLAYVDKDESRSYTIGSVDIYTGGTNAESHNIAYTYKFSGYGEDLKCEKQQITTVEVEVHQTSYLTGNSAKGEDYSNQINSVYFSLPDSLLNDYGELQSIKYEYYQYRTAPMIVVDDYSIYKKLLADAGKILTSRCGYNLNKAQLLQIPHGVITEPGYYVEHYPVTYFLYGSPLITYKYLLYEYSDTMRKVTASLISDPSYLSTFFFSSDLDSNKVLVSSEEIQDYFLNYDASNHKKETVRDKYSADLFDLNYSLKDNDKNGDIHHEIFTRSIDDTFSLDSYLDEYGAWSAFFTYGFGYKNEAGGSVADANYIKQILPEDFNGTAEEISDSLYVSSADVKEFIDFYNNANKDSTVFLLRYAATDDYYATMLGYWEAGQVTNFEHDDALYVEETVYLDFDIIQFTFKDELGKETVISVTSSPTEGFTYIENPYYGDDGIVPDPEPFKDEPQWWQYFIAAALGIATVFVVIKTAQLFKKTKVVVNLSAKNEDRRKK